MKYIKAQDGNVSAVASLIPPARGRDGKGEIWRLNLITAHNSRGMYASFRDMREAITAFETVCMFMESDRSMLSFGIGEGEQPVIPVVEILKNNHATAGGPEQTGTSDIRPSPENAEHLEEWQDTAGVSYVFDATETCWVYNAKVVDGVITRGYPVEEPTDES